MAQPEPATSLLHYLLAAATAIGTAIGAAFAAMKLRRRPNGAATMTDMERLHRKIQEEAKIARHDDIYPEIHKVSIENERDIATVARRIDLVAEAGVVEIKRVELIMAEFAKSIDARLTTLQSDMAVLKDRSDRQERRAP